MRSDNLRIVRRLIHTAEILLQANASKTTTVYHITTIENWKLIQKSGYVDPRKTAKHKSKDQHVTLFTRTREEALSVLRTPFWIARNTDGYVLLTIELPVKWLIPNGLLQGETTKRVPLDMIVGTENLPKIKPRILEVYKHKLALMDGHGYYIFLCKNSQVYYAVDQRADGLKNVIAVNRNRKTVVSLLESFFDGEMMKINAEDSSGLWIA